MAKSAPSTKTTPPTRDELLSFLSVAFPAVYALVSKKDSAWWIEDPREESALDRDLHALYSLDKSQSWKALDALAKPIRQEGARSYLVFRLKTLQDRQLQLETQVKNHTDVVEKAESVLRAKLPSTYTLPAPTHNYIIACDALWLKTYHEQSWWARLRDPARSIMRDASTRAHYATLWGRPMNQLQAFKQSWESSIHEAEKAQKQLDQFQHTYPVRADMDMQALHEPFMEALLSWSQWPAVIAAAQHSYTVRPKPSTTRSGIGYPSRAPSPQRTSSSSPSSRRRYDDDAPAPSWSPSPSQSTWDSWSSPPPSAPAPSDYTSGGGGDFGGGGASGGWDSGGYSSSDSGSSCGSSD